ncbi:hypothetical protein ACMFKE_04825 [Staphylococcus haemolyticus]|uniref:hypothetical protein n=1 Tax=Staphylococcus haemolyticus TaxID=1283 RepID=UPI0039BCE2B7
MIIIDTDTKDTHVIINNTDELINFYYKHINNFWIGYNSREYDQWILKGILSGFNPKEINDFIVKDKKKGWQYSGLLHKVKLLNYDVQTGFHSLKQLEGFMGNDIRETTVSFDTDRKLTDREIKEVIKYCKHDVEQTIQVFMNRFEEFQSHIALIQTFGLPMKNLTKTKAQLSAMILDAQQPKVKRDDEMEYTIPNTLRINKYHEVVTFYQTTRDYNKSLKLNIAGVPHEFAWGGLHGARKNYFSKGYFLNVDVASYYPALMIEYDYLSRNVPNKKKYRQIRDKRLELKAKKDKRQAPFKIVLNSTYGAMKDKHNGLYDPRQANNVCVAGMLLLLDLIEKLEPHCEIVQSNTDGILIKMHSLDDFGLIDDICFEWEERTHMELEFDHFTHVIQKDVNNYILVNDRKGIYKSKGTYVKKLNNLDNDLPIVNKSIVDYFVKNIPVEKTIRECDELIMFQKIVKVSGKYQHAIYGTKVMHEKVFRVFASKDSSDKSLMKVKNNKPEKIGYTPTKCFIDNKNIIGKKIPPKLNKDWYIAIAKKRINDFKGEQFGQLELSI